MKRSERLFSKALQHAGWCAVILAASVAAGVWSVRAWQAAEGWGALVAAAALIGSTLSYAKGCEMLRLLRLANTEARWEHEREIRPRL